MASRTTLSDVFVICVTVGLAVWRLAGRRNQSPPELLPRVPPAPVARPVVTASGNVYPIYPTAPPNHTGYTDISLTGLFSTHVLLINSERQAIWQRFTAMVVGNSVVVSIATVTNLLPWVGIGVSLLGFALCVAWMVLTWSGYNHYKHLCGLAKRFCWPGLEGSIENPVTAHVERVPRDWIFRMAIGIIGLFMLGYIVMFCSHGYTIVRPPGCGGL